MDAMGWLMIVIGAVMFLLGLAAVFGRIGGLPRHEGRAPIALGAGIVLVAIGRLRDLPGADWVLWAGALLPAASLVLLWRTDRRMKAAGHQPPTQSVQ